MKIGPYEIQNFGRVFIVAEISSNHNGSLRKAKALVMAAKDARADAVKFQFAPPDHMTVDSKHPAYKIQTGPWKGWRLHNLYRKALTPFRWLEELFSLAESLDLVPLASTFSVEAVREVDEMFRPQCHKIASAEVSDMALVKAMKATGKPIILSDGMATMNQMALALDELQGQSVFLRCVSDYPAKPESYGLQLVRSISGSALPVGISDHSRGSTVAVSAVTLGACVIEKHIKLDRWHYFRAPLDAKFSITPGEFATMVEDVRAVEAALQEPPKMGQDTSAGWQWRRRLVFTQDMGVGQVINPDIHLRTARCAEGLEPDMLESLQGRELRYCVSRGDPVTEEALR